MDAELVHRVQIGLKSVSGAMCVRKMKMTIKGGRCTGQWKIGTGVRGRGIGIE